MHCPDVCPTTLAELANVVEEVRTDGGAGGRLQVVFVSVDPGRDAPERLGEYVTFFDSGFLGVTGTARALEGLTRQLGIFVRRGTPNDEGEYLVEHGGAVLLIDPEGRVVGVFQAPHDPAEITDSLRRIRRFLAG
jgi:protein SCO1/2